MKKKALAPRAKHHRTVPSSLGAVCTRKWPVLLCLLLLARPSQAQDYLYTIDNNGTTITITKYTGPGGEVAIPGTINGRPVTRIAGAFDHCTNLTAVVIPNSVTNITPGSFTFCSRLATVSLPTNLMTLGGDSFSFCTSLTNVHIPASIPEFGIGPGPFAFCTNLAAITVDAHSLSYASIDGVLTTKEGGAALIQFPGGRRGSYRVPDQVSTISDSAFSGCLLTGITMHHNVTILWEYAFFDCTALTAAYFEGWPPEIISPWSSSPFELNENVILYHVQGHNWGSLYGGRPTAVWKPLIQRDDQFGIRTNHFGFNVSWAVGGSFVIESSTALPTATWMPISTNTLLSPLYYFTDSSPINSTGRFYRIRAL